MHLESVGGQETGDGGAPRAFEGMMASELVRRFGDRRMMAEHFSRTWVIEIVRDRYWRLWAYLILSTVVWLVVWCSAMWMSMLVLAPERSVSGMMLLGVLWAIALGPLGYAIERRLCGPRVLGSAGVIRVEQMRVASDAELHNAARDQAA